MIKRVKHMYVYAIFIDNLHVGVNLSLSHIVFINLKSYICIYYQAVN